MLRIRNAASKVFGVAATAGVAVLVGLPASPAAAIQPVATLTGTVLVNGTPAAGVTVEVSTDLGGGQSWSNTGDSTADGTYSIGLAYEGVYTVGLLDHSGASLQVSDPDQVTVIAEGTGAVCQITGVPYAPGAAHSTVSCTDSVFTPPSSVPEIPTGGPVVVPAVTSIPSGSTLRLSVTQGGQPYTGSVYAYLYSVPVALSSGPVAVSAGVLNLTIPSSVPAGTHNIVLYDVLGDPLSSTQISVSHTLAATGSNPMPILLGGIAFVLLGAALFVLTWPRLSARRRS